MISVGHDEYWTKGMRDAVELARDKAVKLAFLGGNDVLWQGRLEPDRAGNPRRILTVYRDADRDPVDKVDPALVSVVFIDPVLNRPQNSLTDTDFGGIIEQPPGVPWVAAGTALQELLTGTGLRPVDTVADLTGKECDTVDNKGFQPKDLVIIAASSLTDKNCIAITCHTTWYRASSDAHVFNAGTLSWPAALDDFGHHNPGLHADPRVIQLMKNSLSIFTAAW